MGGRGGGFYDDGPPDDGQAVGEVWSENLLVGSSLRRKISGNVLMLDSGCASIVLCTMSLSNSKTK